MSADALELQRFAIKFFLRDPASVRPEEVLRLFHRWIQERRVEGILIDVADYAHVPDGPGVVLIGFEADYFLDSMEGPAGLLYNRKRPLEGALPARLRAALRAALDACARLEAEPEFEGAVRFRGDEALFIANDRLLAPNTEETFAVLRPSLEEAFGALWGGAARLEREGGDPRRRLAVRVRGDRPAEAAALRERLGA
ncbi:MAG TPA: hypothetical protein VNO22_18595 [Planctomycetota bacterium]|nr:hypothetical protein [Planctomycetota bacterium]